MKRTIFSLLVLTSITLSLFTSCNKKGNTLQFEIMGAVVYQSFDEGDVNFIPYVAFGTNLPMTQASILYKGIEKRGVFAGDVIYEMSPQVYTDISEFTGAYNVTASNADSSIEYDIHISLTNSNLFDSDIEVSDFEYKDGKLVAKFKTLTAGSAYGFQIVPIVDGKEVSRMARHDLYTVKQSGDIQSVELEFNSANINAGSVKIYPVAFSLGENRTPILLLGTAKTLKENGTAFE